MILGGGDLLVQVSGDVGGEILAAAVGLACQHLVQLVDLGIALVLVAPDLLELFLGLIAVESQIVEDLLIRLGEGEVEGIPLDHGLDGVGEDRGQADEVGVDDGAEGAVLAKLMVVAVIAQGNLDAAREDLGQIAHAVLHDLTVGEGEVAGGADREVVVGGTEEFQGEGEAAHLIHVIEGDVDIVVAAGLEVDHHGEVDGIVVHPLAALVDVILGAVAVEDPAVHLPLAVGGDAVGTRLLGNELVEQTSGHDDAVVVDVVVSTQHGIVGGVGSQAADGIVQMNAVCAVGIVVGAHLEPLVGVVGLQADGQSHLLQKILQLGVDRAEAVDGGVGGVVAVFDQLLVVVDTVDLDLAVVGMGVDGEVTELGGLHEIHQQDGAVLIPHVPETVRLVEDGGDVGLIAEAVGGAVGGGVAGNVGGDVDLTFLDYAEVFQVDDVVAYGVRGVLGIAEGHLIGAVLLGDVGEAGVPLVRLARDLVDILGIHQQVEQVGTLLAGGPVVKGQSLACLHGDVGIHDGEAVVLARVGGDDDLFAVLLLDDEGPVHLGVLILGLGAVGDGDVTLVEDTRDLVGGGHGHIGLFGGHQLVQAVEELLLVVLGGEMLEHGHEGSIADDTARLDHADDTVAVHQHRGGIALNVEGGSHVGVVLSHGEGQAALGTLAYVVGIEVILELLDTLLGVAAEGGVVQGHDLDLVLVLLIHGVHVGELLDAPGAGGVPEVDEHHLLGLQQLGELLGIAVGVHHGKVPHDIAQLVGLTAVVGVLDDGGGEGDLGGRAGQGVAGLGLVALGHARKNGHVLVALLQGDLGHTQSVGGGVVDQILQGVVGVDVDVDTREHQTACGLDRDGVLGLGLGASGLGLIGGDGLGGLAGGLIGFGSGVAGGEGRQQHEHRQDEGEGLVQFLHFSSPIRDFVRYVCDGLQRSIEQHRIAYHKPREKSRGFPNFL